jgi:hypothetical protein
VSVNRVMRYLGGLILASILLYLILPFAGIPQSKFLPPPIVYNKATGSAYGVITKKEVGPVTNPFKVGDHIYLLDYKFKAPTPPPRGQLQYGPKQLHTAQIRVDVSVWGDPDSAQKSGMQPGQTILVRYEKTYPDINGVYRPDLGRGCGPGSNILSGWLLFLLLDLAIAYGFMTLLERFGRQENI